MGVFVVSQPLVDSGGTSVCQHFRMGFKLRPDVASRTRSAQSLPVQSVVQYMVLILF